MSEFPQEFIVHNQAELEDLAWELEASAEQFSLILARCNYANLREQLVESLRQLCSLEIRVLVLNSNETALYTRIQAELAATPPGALLVFGLETVNQREQLLSTANQVREEFRKNCPFPIVLWVTDDVQRILVNAAPDLESWATKTHFTLPPDALNQGLQQASDRLFSALLSPEHHQALDTQHLNLDLGLFHPSEVTAAVQELRSYGQEIDPTLQASLDFVRGLQAENSEEALKCFERSLKFWQQSQEPSNAADRNDLMLRKGLLLFYIGQAQYGIGDSESQARNWERVRRSLQTSIAKFAQANRLDLVAHCVPLLERVLQKLQVWDALEDLARKASKLHRAYRNPTRLSQDYGFLAKAALEQQHWTAAQQAAQQALIELAKAPDNRLWLRGLYLLFLAQAERQLGNPEAAIAHLIEANAGAVSDRGYPKFAIRILEELRDLYFERQQYLDAFHARQERLSIEQQYGIRAFVGAGRLQPRRQAAVTEFQAQTESMVAPEIAAAGRQQDLTRLIKQIGRQDYRLIVIHGDSGVGKSSLVAAGLVPTLKQKAIATRNNLPVVLRTYTQWAQELDLRLEEELRHRTGRQHNRSSDAHSTPDTLLEKLRRLDQGNLRTVLIFDQFEEFFFVYPQPEERKPFFDFLVQCLQILSLKVVLSLREDYLHLLLEVKRLPAMAQNGIDILSRNVLYELGNFSPRDARAIIQSLTERARFYLEPALVDRLVEDLAQEVGTVRPIELQVVGAQLQEEGITTLVQYRDCGQQPKQELVKRYLDGVVTDCGIENRPLAELVLFLLTDEKGTRPLKTRAELKKELQSPALSLGETDNALDLVLQILVASGLVFLLPEAPADRYQLVHDYIAVFVRQQQAPQLEKLLADLDTERQHRQQAERALLALEDQKQTAEAKLGILKSEQDRAEQTLITTTQKVKRRSLLGVAALVLAVVAGTAAAFSTVNATEAERRAKSAEASAQTNVEAAEVKIAAVEATAKRRQRDAETQVQGANRQVRDAQSKQRDADAKAQQANQDVERAQAELTRIGEQSTQSIRAAQARLQQAEQRAAQARQEQLIAATQVEAAQALLLTAQSQQELALTGATLERAGVRAMRRFEFQQTEALLAATRAGQQLKTLVQADGIQTLGNYPALSPILALQTSLDTISETRFQGHQGRLTQVTFSSDGQRLATSGVDGTARLWSLQGQELAKLEGHQGVVSQVTFSPDGQRLATSGEDGTARLWNLQGQELAKLQGHQGYIYQVTFSPDGQRLATSGVDGTARLWNLQGQELAKLEGHQGRVTQVTFSPDAQRLATRGEDGTARLWNLQGQELAKLEGHQGSVWQVTFSPDGQRLATSGVDGTARLWTLQGEELAKLEGHQGYVFEVTFSPDGQRLATSGFDGTARLWNLQGQELAKLEGHQGYLNDVTFSPDGQRLATSGLDSTARLWNLQGEELAKLEGHQGMVYQVTFSPDGQRLATSGSDGTARLWNLQRQELAKLEGNQGFLTDVTFSPDGQRLATGGEDGTARLWSLQGQELAKLEGHQRVVYQVMFSPDGQRLATVEIQGTARLWSLQGQELAKLEGHQGSIFEATFSPDGQRLATGGEDGTARLWNLQGQELAKLEGHQGSVSQVTFSPDGQRLATSGVDGTARLWNLQGQELAKLEGHQGSVYQVTFSSDGQRLATSGVDGTARLWNLQGQELAKLEGHQGSVSQVTFSPDGQRLATGGSDGTARLWNLQGQELAKLEGHQGQVTFSPDGQQLATGGVDGTVRLWNLQGQQIAQFEGRGALSSDWSRIAIIQPINPLLSDATNEVVTLWRVDDLNGLLARACDRLHWYLTYSQTVTESDRAMCGIAPRQ